MNSREKVLSMRGDLLRMKPEDEESAQGLQILVGLMPMLLKALPEEPEQLDGLLEQLAIGALSCRSDGTLVMEVHSWDAEGNRWENHSPRPGATE